MEKFGIFELLDALSAVLDGKNDAPPPDEPPAETPDKSRAEPTAVDASFLPPDYAGSTQEGGALSSFLSRHDETVKRIEKKKPT